MNPVSANNGKIGCGCEGAPIDIEEVVAVLRLWKAGRNVVEKNRIIISTSMNADGRWNVESGLGLVLGFISGFSRQGVGMVQSTRPTRMIMAATMATTKKVTMR